MDALLSLGVFCLLADLVLGSFLSPWYYMHGIPVLRIRRAVPDGMRPIPTAEALQQRFSSFLGRGFVVSDFGGATYGFRYNLFFGSGLLQRVISFEPREALLEVQGRIGVFLPGFLIAAAVLTTDFPGAAPLAFLVIGGLYLTDVVSAARFASAAQSLWVGSEEHPAA